MATSGSERTPSFRIELREDRPDREYTERASRFSAALLSDAMHKLNTMDWRVKPVWNCADGLCGPALTVRIRPGDNAMCIKAISLAQPGDVIVVQAHGDTTHSIWGGIMAEQAIQRGIAGVITDGLIRDTADLERRAFPIWALGATPLAPNRNVPPGQIGTRIVCASTVVETGDLIRADRDGVVVIPRSEIADVLDRAEALQQKEQAWIVDIRNGVDVLLPPVDDLLNSAGIAIIGMTEPSQSR